MITMLDLGPDILAYRAEGKVERDDIDRVFADVDRKLTGGDDFNVYTEVGSFSGMSLDALWRDVRLGLERLEALSRIPRAALVTDIGWIRKAAMVEDKVVRGVHIRVFSLSEQRAARDWVGAQAPNA